MINENIIEDMSKIDRHSGVQEKVAQMNTNSFIKKYVYTFSNKDENGKNYKFVLEPQSHEKEMELVKKYGTILEMLPLETLPSDK